MLNKKKNIKIWMLPLFISVGVFFFMFFAKASISEIKNINATANTHDIFVEWDHPMLQETEGIIMLRKQGSCPRDAFDGENVYRGNGNSFVDDSANKKTPYCYGAYVYDSSGAISEPKTSELVEIKSLAEYVQLILEDNIFFGIGIILIVILVWLNAWKRKRAY